MGLWQRMTQMVNTQVGRYVQDPNERESTLQLLGMRGFLIGSIVLVHCINYAFSNPDASPQARFAQKLPRLDFLHEGQQHAGTFFNSPLVGWMSGLFVLSGFHLYRRWARAALAGRPQDIRVGYFLQRRAARILPLYFLVLLFSIAVMYGGTPAQGVRWPTELWPHFVMLQGYFVGTFQTLNPVTWFLSVDIAFYLLLPLMGWVGLRLRDWRWHLALLVLWGVLGMAWRAWAVGRNPLLFMDFPAWLPFFALGMAGALVLEHLRAQRGSMPRLGPWWTGLLLVGGAGICALDVWNSPQGAHQLWTFGWVWLGIIPLSLAVVYGSGPAVAPLRWPNMAAAGLVSYGTFLWHLPLLIGLRRLDLLHFGWPGTLILITVLVSVVAWTSFLWLELPIQQWAERRGRK